MCLNLSPIPTLNFSTTDSLTADNIRMIKISISGDKISIHGAICLKKNFFKGTVARDFRPLVFFMTGPNKDP